MTLSSFFENGYFKLFRVRGVPVRMFWLTPLVLWMLAELRFIPGWWIGILTVILLHELGHAAAVWAFKGEVLAVDLLPFGGECSWRGQVTPTQRAIIAWGGVSAQAVLWACATIALIWFTPHGSFQWHLVRAFTSTNLYLIGLNLLPVRPLDGAEAWPLLTIVWQERAAKLKKRLDAERAIATRRQRLTEHAEAADRRADALDEAAARAIDEALARKMNVKSGQR